MGIHVTPKERSFVNDWEAVQFKYEDFALLRKLFRFSPWIVQLVLTDDGAQAHCTQVQNGQVQQWVVVEGSWVIRSPHGYYWFMDEEQFKEQFWT